MNDRIPKNEYEVSYLHLIFFVLIFILLLLISFFIGYKTGEKGKCKKVESILVKGKRENTKSISPVKGKGMPEVKTKEKARVEKPVPKVEEKVSRKEELVKKEEKKETIAKKLEKKEGVEKSKKKKYRSGYYVQIAAAKDFKLAEKEARKYRKYFKVVIFTPSETDRRKFYRLRTGPFRTKAQAKSFLLKIKSRYKIKGFIVKID